MLNKELSAGTKAEQSTNDEVTTSSPTIGKPNVSSSLCPSTQDLFPINQRCDLSVIDYHFSVHSNGDDKIMVPYVPLYNYLKSIEMLQVAEYQIKVLKEALSELQPMNQ